MSFTAATAYLHGTIDERRSPHDLARLDRMALLLKELGDPQLAYPTIHVGGTSGKGSTSAMIASVLQASGKRCGLHTKPHLSLMTERMRVDGVPVSKDRFGALLSLITPTLDEVARKLGRPTYFETLLALSYVHFLEEKVDVAVIEVGVGGTLDGTNILAPVLSVITNVGLDHQEILGDTIEEIARDKAGIAKPGVPLISSAEEPARAVIRSVCRDVGTPFFLVRDETAVTVVSESAAGQHFGVATATENYDIGTTVLGAFQRKNAACAIAACEHLPPDLRPGKDAIERGFAALRVPGRMELIPAHPPVLFDVAHNVDKIGHLIEALGALFPARRLHFVLAISESKDAAGIVAILRELPATFTLTTFEAPGRTGVRPDRLATYFEGAGHLVRVIEDPREAFAVARRTAAGDDLVVVTGSTVLVGIIRDLWIETMLPTAS